MGRSLPMTVRAVRGAIQVDSADRDAILEATAELVAEVMTRNELTTDDVVSVLFTATPDLTAEFPALAARKIGFHDVPLICASEIAVPGAMPRVVRLMAHIQTDRPRSAIQHVPGWPMSGPGSGGYARPRRASCSPGKPNTPPGSGSGRRSASPTSTRSGGTRSARRAASTRATLPGARG